MICFRQKCGADRVKPVCLHCTHHQNSQTGLLAMRYCPNCRRINEQWPDHCRYCGSTWGVKICRGGHLNPAGAVYCGQCGSAHLTQPASGCGLVNLIFGLCRGQGWIRFAIKVAVPICLLVILSKHLELVLPFLVALYVLVSIFKHTFGVLPPWVTGPIMRFYRSRVREYTDRARETR